VDETPFVPSIKKLRDSIETQPGWWEPIHNDRSNTGWFLRALSAVALLSNGEHPQYVTGSFNQDADEGVVHAFYARTLITSKIAGTRGGGAPVLTVIGRSRNGLRSLEVEADFPFGVAPQLTHDTWPGNVRVVTVYDDGHELALPVARVENSDHRGQIIEFLPSLRADIES
jgi:hypothetical protein